MVKEVTLSSVISATGTVVSMIVVLLGTAVGWGTLKTRISSLEERTFVLERKLDKIDDDKVDKVEYRDMIREIHQDSRDIKQDIKELLKRTKG